MKIIGALLIFAAFCSFGITIWKEKKARIETLSQLCFALELMTSELTTMASPLPELVKILSHRCRGHISDFFSMLGKSLSLLGSRDLPSLWCAAAEKTLKCLHCEEKEEILSLGYVLGRYELHEQLAAVNNSITYFRMRRDAAQASSAEERKLSLGLTAAAGALLAIVFL